MTRQPWCGAPRNNVDQYRSVQGATRNGAPGRLLASPSGANPDGAKPLHHDTVADPRRGVVVEWLII